MLVRTPGGVFGTWFVVLFPYSSALSHFQVEFTTRDAPSRSSLNSSQVQRKTPSSSDASSRRRRADSPRVNVVTWDHPLWPGDGAAGRTCATPHATALSEAGGQERGRVGFLEENQATVYQKKENEYRVEDIYVPADVDIYIPPK